MTDDETQLKNVDPEDIEDLLPKIERSFGIKFTQQDIDKVSNFGALCDLVESLIYLPHADGCTSQQAFYKLREAIGQINGIGKDALTPSSKLEDIFPRKNRRRQIKELERIIGFSFKMLKPKSWVVNGIIISFLTATVLIFVNWKFGLAAFCFSILFTKVADYFGNELDIDTLGEAAKYFVLENYLVARRNAQTVNKTEIAATIKELFQKHLYLPERALTRDATFN